MPANTTTNTPVSLYDAVGLEKLRRNLRLDPETLRKLRNALFKKGLGHEQAWRELPETEAQPLRNHIAPPPLRLEREWVSERDDARKFLLRTRDGAPIETVLMRPNQGRASLCLSCQVGCACACRFCATGTLGLQRHLEAEEIAEQVTVGLHLARRHGAHLRNIMFMGMGEPFHTPHALSRALDLLTHPALFHFAPRRIMVSTCGIASRIEPFARRFPEVRLAVSLHTVNQPLRDALMPGTAAHPLPLLRESLRRAAHHLHHPILIEILLLAETNDRQQDAHDVADYLEGLPVRINLLRLNAATTTDDLRPADTVREQAFTRTLEQRGFEVTPRYSLGTDIGAACGQLAAGVD